MSNSMSTAPFWLVWCETHRPPAYKHPSEDSARTEAERLARLHPGHAFHVLEWAGTCRKVDVEWAEPQKIPF